MQYRLRGFTLLEVVAAIAVAAIAIVPALAFLSVGSADSMRTRDRLTALTLVDAVRLEFPGAVPTSSWARFPGLQLAASRDGSGLHVVTSVASAGEYFLVDVIGSDIDTPGSIGLQVNISWPFRLLREGRVTETDPANRDHVEMGLRIRG
jgi:prepilin-type N-terminal cleavage/methylation domain-containing protein